MSSFVRFAIWILSLPEFPPRKLNSGCHFVLLVARVILAAPVSQGHLLLSCGFKMHLAEMHDVDRCTPQIAGNHPRRIKSPFRLKIAVRMDDNWAEQEMRGCMNRELVAVCVRTAHGIQVLRVATETACYFVLKQGLLPPEVAHNLRTELLDIDRQSGTEKDTEELARSIPCSFHTLHAEC